MRKSLDIENDASTAMIYYSSGACICSLITGLGYTIPIFLDCDK